MNTTTKVSIMYTWCIHGHMERGIKFNARKGASGFKAMTARFDGRCIYQCGRPLLAGMEIIYAVQERHAFHVECSPFKVA